MDFKDANACSSPDNEVIGQIKPVFMRVSEIYSDNLLQIYYKFVVYNTC